ncbi:MAG: hypothetical protein HKN80_06225 [Acidimicrobiia bacterium]|nr:hypothetical protein [Acidimicrobiia bacterium]NNC92070.1 hypothetical protein [Acidimicrobiia bacterium]
MARLRPLALLAALTLIAGACSGDSFVENTATTAPTPTTARPATTTPGDGETNDARDEIQARIDELIIEAQQLRDLEFLEPVEVILLSDEEYQARFREIIDEELATEDVEAINAVLRLLGIIQPDDDYLELIETLLTSGTGGFYDPDTGELVVRLFDDEFGPYAESVVIHELVHALQDQHFDLLDNDDLEGDLAYVASAIVEGDALLREVSYVQAMSLADQAAYIAATADIDLSALDTLPGYIVEGFQAAYLDGFFFHQEIGLDEIDSQFTNLPESSEQLLDQDKYRRDEQPRPVVLPDLELPGYTLWFDATAGQKDLELLLTDGIGAGEAERAAVGWGGDANRIYNTGEDEAVYILQYLGDTKVEAEQLEAAFVEFIDNMVSDDAFTVVERDADELLVIIASDPAVGPSLRAAFSS